MKPIFSRSMPAVLAMLLVACGGGGGGGSTTTAPTPADLVVPSTITAATVTPNYPDGSEELAAYNTLSTARTTCGFGGLNQNTLLDQAALNHNFYMAVNSSFTHSEVSGSRGFTGANSNDRATFVGYPLVRPTFSENLYLFSGTSNKLGYGAKGVTGLLGAPYHLRGLVGAHREVGLSVRSSGIVGSGADYAEPGLAPAVWLSISAGSTQALTPQRQSSSDVLTYPCNGVTGTAYQLTGESPNPVTPRDLATNPIGQPILVQLLEGRLLVVSSASVTGPGGSVALLPTMTYANDPNFRVEPHQAIIMPNLPLAPNTSYSVVINGTNNGVAFTRSFSFTTGG